MLRLDGLLTFDDFGLCDVDVEWRRICEIPQTRFVGHHGTGRAVLLPMRWLRQIDLIEFEQKTRLKHKIINILVSDWDICGMYLRATYWGLNFTRCVLGLCLQINCWRILDDALNGHLEGNGEKNV